MLRSVRENLFTVMLVLFFQFDNRGIDVIEMGLHKIYGILNNYSFIASSPVLNL